MLTKGMAPDSFLPQYAAILTNASATAGELHHHTPGPMTQNVSLRYHFSAAHANGNSVATHSW